MEEKNIEKQTTDTSEIENEELRFVAGGEYNPRHYVFVCRNCNTHNDFWWDGYGSASFYCKKCKGYCTTRQGKENYYLAEEGQ